MDLVTTSLLQAYVGLAFLHLLLSEVFSCSYTLVLLDVFGTDFEFDRTYLCNGTWYQQSERNLWIYRDSPTYPQIW